MFIDLTDVLSEQHKSIEKNVALEMDVFQREKENFPVIEKKDVHILIEFIEEKKISITGQTKLIIAIPCDRCLEMVETSFPIEFQKRIDLNEDAEDSEEIDENNFIEGKQLNLEQLIRNEILVSWPMKTLCSEQCEGIVYEKEDALDPRMAAALDVFKNFQS